MTKIVIEKSVVYVMVGGGTESQNAESSVPNVNILTVDQAEPIRVQAPKSHIAPDIAITDDLRTAEKGDENHQYSVGSAAIESVEVPRVDESVMRLVGDLVQLWACNVLYLVHDKLKEIGHDQGHCDLTPSYTALKAIIFLRKNIKHPGDRKIADHQAKSLRLGEVCEDSLGKAILTFLQLNAGALIRLVVKILVKDCK